MKHLYTAILLISVLFFTACKKYLDIKPKGTIIPQTVEDFERILNDASLARNLPNYLDQLTDDFYNTSLDPDKHEVNSENQVYLWRADIFSTPEDYQYNSFYNLLYANIYQYNAIINGIDEASGGSPTRKAAAKARAQLGRALSYWYLVNLYAKPYDAQSAGSNPGVSLVLSNDINAAIPGRGTIQQTFDFILKDLNEAIPALPLSASDPYQLTKAAGYGFLARTYITMNNYAKAGEAADKALALNNKLIDYNTEYAVYDDGTLNFIYAKSGSQMSNMLTAVENIFVQHYSYTRGMAYSTIATATEALFSTDDLRRIYITPNSINLSDPSEWDGTYIYMGYTSSNYNIGITTPEMYLIRAEANARSGNIQLALDDLKTLRKNRIKTSAYTDLTAGDKKTATQLVLTERRKELLFKGVRWFDMRRLNNDPDFGFTARHYFYNGTFIELKPNSDRYTLRLPETAINTDIVQNP